MKRILIIAGILFALGCKKQPDPTIPFIDITSPIGNQHFFKGDIIHIRGTVTHDKALTEVAVHIIDLTTKIEFFQYYFSPGSQQFFNYYSSYTITDNAKSTFKLEVKATDKDGVSASEEMLMLIN